MTNCNLDEKDQKTLIEMIYSSPSVFSRVRPILKSEYFDKKFQPTINYLLDFSQQYNTLPILEQLNNESRIEYQYLNDIENNVNVQSSILDTCEKFVKKRALELAIEEAYSYIAKGETSGIDKIIKDAQNISLEKDLGMNFWDKPNEWLKQQESEQGILPTGWKTFDDMMNGGFGWGELNYVVAPVNAGKCEIKGTKILMFDGSIKTIENIKVGDKLMGPDSTPRTVKSLTNGKEKLFKISFKGGDDMYVTGEHTLNLKVCKSGKPYNRIHPITGKKLKVGDTFNITVNDYIKTSKNFKQYTKLWRASVDFNEKPLTYAIEPYYLGLWLGDGSSRTSEITSIDKEIIEYLDNYAKKYNVNCIHTPKVNTNALDIKFFGHYLKGQNKDKRSNGTYTKNYILHGLQELNLIKNKHIPTNYLYNTKEVRKSLLAGIIDIDGCIDTKRHRYEITLKTSQLSDDVITLSRSLGYKVYVSKKKVKAYENNDYTRITIYGDLSDLPIQLPRKKQTYKVLKDYSTSQFNIVQNEYEDEYYGFELDKDNLYLHSDFMVTHNSLCMQNMALNWSMNGYNVLFFTLEMNRRLVGKRMASMAANVPYRDIRNNIDKVSDSIIYRRKDIQPGVLQLVDLPIGCNANDIEGFIQTFEIQTNIIPQIIVIDYADIMTPCDKRIDPNRLNRVDKAISLELRDIARERTKNGKNTMILTASQITKDSMDEMEFGMSKVAGGTTKTQNADNIFSVRTNDAMRQRGEYEFKFLKTRNAGSKDKKLKMKFNVDTLLISDLEEMQTKTMDTNSDPTQNVNPMASANLQAALASLKGLSK